MVLYRHDVSLYHHVKYENYGKAILVSQVSVICYVLLVLLEMLSFLYPVVSSNIFVQESDNQEPLSWKLKIGYSQVGESPLWRCAAMLFLTDKLRESSCFLC